MNPWLEIDAILAKHQGGLLFNQSLVDRERTCDISPCGLYRNVLRVIWDKSRKPKMFIGLNPSKADMERNDPTLLRCVDFAVQWDCGGLVMANACAYRSTDPQGMLSFEGDQIGPQNTLEFLNALAAECAGNPIAAWGKHADEVSCFMASGGTSAKPPSTTRGDFLKRFMGPLDCLRLNKDGSPQHPLYLPASLKPIPFNYKLADSAGCAGEK